MPGDLLKEFESVQNLKAGTRFFKADLHFHTPASEDARGSNRYNFNPYGIEYPKGEEQVLAVQAGILRDARLVAEKIVDRFVEVGLSLVAVTDHNGIGTIWSDAESQSGAMDLAAPTWYEVIDDAAQQKNQKLGYTAVVILPGVEISTTGVHILAVFPPQEPRRKVHFMICDLLNEIGFDVEEWGKNPEVGDASVVDALELVIKKGGLAIPAHIDGSDQALLDLYDLTSGAMKNVLQNECLRAVEIVDPARFSRVDKKTKQTLKSMFDEVRRKAGLPSLAYFQGSDAHDLPTVSKRFSYLKMTDPSFSGLQTAIKMPSSRVRIPESYKELNGLYLRGMVLDHPYLGVRSLRFNRNMNCISGKRGAGKTSLFDLMQGVVNPQFLKMDGTATLFVEQIQDGNSQVYAYRRVAGTSDVKVFSIDPKENTFRELSLEEAKACDLQPGFYNPERMEEIILDNAKLNDFLCRNFGEATDENVRAFNQMFSLPRFLEEKGDPLLVISRNKKEYQLSLNMQWRTDKPVLKDFFSLGLSQRRAAMMCMIIVSGQFGPVIIDAPEDEFDHEDMTKYLLPVIQEQKDTRQIILFTNHPILAVNTDPDNYLLLLTRDGVFNGIVSGFAIDSKLNRPLLFTIFEGNIETFRKRASRYE